MTPSPQTVRRPILIVLGFLAMTSSVFAQGRPERVRILIGFRTPPGQAEETDLRGRGAEISHRYHLVPAMAVSIPVTALDGIRHNPNVTVVEPDGTVNMFDAELDAAWGVSRIGAGAIHDSGNKGTGVKVAIVDTGIDCTHPDLDGNCMGGMDFVNDDNDPSDDHGHGTHVAGTVAGEDDGNGVVGVVPEAQLYGLKVLSAGGAGYWSDIIAAIEWAADHGIQVTNNSYGGSGYPGSIVEAAFDESYARGVLHIAAAGNSGNCDGTGDSVLYPARFSSVVAVAATMSNDVRACFSSTGPAVEIAAPGVYINSTRRGGGYIAYSGTSMASPHVAGAAALIFASGIDSNEDVRQRLDNSADDLGVAGRDAFYGFGMVDPEGALAALPPNAAPEVTITGPADNSRFDSDAPVDLTGTAFDLDDGDLSASLEWMSDVDGPLGVGSDVSAFLTEGVHTIELSATDADGVMSSDSMLLTVTRPALPGEVRVASIAYTPEDLGRRKNPLHITVTVVDADGVPVSGAKVVVKITRRLRIWRLRGFTGADGRVTVSIQKSPRGCYVTKVRKVRSEGLTWDHVTPANQYCQ